MILSEFGNTGTYSTFLYVGIFLPNISRQYSVPLGLFFNPFSLPLSSPLSSENSLRFQRKVSPPSSFIIPGLSSGVIFPPASQETRPFSPPMRGFIKRFITPDLSTLWQIAHPPSLAFLSKPYFFWAIFASINSSSLRRNFSQ